jgi:hypothetical protein
MRRENPRVEETHVLPRVRAGKTLGFRDNSQVERHFGIARPEIPVRALGGEGARSVLEDGLQQGSLGRASLRGSRVDVVEYEGST